MVAQVGAAARAYGALTMASLRSSVQRPATLVVRGIGSALVALCEAVGVVLLVDRFGSIAGWRTPEIIVLAGLVFTGQGLAQAVGNRLRPDDVSLMIRRGTFDQVLTRPISPLGFVLTGYVEIRLLGRFVAGVGLLAWAGRAAGIAWTPSHLAVAALAIACCAVVVFAVLVLGAALTFYTLQGSEAVNVVLDGGAYLTGYPMEIYGSALRALFTWVFPFALAVYVPALALLGRTGPRGLGTGLLWVAPLGSAWLAAVAWLAWRRAIRHYVAAGAFVGYAGPNGAGKSTTIKMMSGLLVPTSGRVVVDGLVPSRERRRLARRIGVVFGQRTQLWWDLPLEQSFRLVRHLYRIGAADYQRRLDHLIEVLQLGPLLQSPVRSLSLGQRMRSELAAAVLPRPRVLFLDEPTIGLDVEAKAAVRGFLRELNRGDGTTVILTTHDLDDIAELCERLLIIDHGRVIYDGTVEELRHRYGTTRVLVIDLRDDVELVVEGAKLVRADGYRRWLEFARDEVSAAVLIARVMAAHEVVDLTLEEPDIEDIVRRIYRGEAGL